MRWEEFLRTLGKDDVQPLARISAFAWKCLGSKPEDAYRYAVHALYDLRHGADEPSRRAATVLSSAELWCKEHGVDAARWGLECVEAGRGKV